MSGTTRSEVSTCLLVDELRIAFLQDSEIGRAIDAAQIEWALRLNLPHIA